MKSAVQQESSLFVNNFYRIFKNLNIVFLFPLVDSVFCAKCPHCDGCSGENAQQCHREFGQVS